MLAKILIGYCGIAVAMFLLAVIIGKILNKDVLGNGVKLGILNALLLSLFWPLTLILALCGVLYDVIRVWKKL